MQADYFANADPVGDFSEKAGMSVQKFSKRRKAAVWLRDDAEDPDPAKFFEEALTLFLSKMRKKGSKINHGTKK